MTTLIPKFDFQNGGSTPTGAVNIPINIKLAESLSVIDFGADPTGVADSTTAIQNAINAAATTTGYVIFPVGTFKITAPLSIVGLNVNLIGAGQFKTIIKASGTLTTIIDASSATEDVYDGFSIVNLTLDGNSTTTTGINIKFRHRFIIDHLVIQGVQYGITAESAYIGHYYYTRITATTTSLNFVGSCHASLIEKCTLVSFTAFGVVINNAALGDGNNAMLFLNNDIEYSGTGGGAVYINSATSSVTFDTCYIGEGVNSAIFTVVAGLVLIKGGLVKYGKTSSSVGFALSQGALVGVENARVESEGALDLSGLIYAPVSGSPAISGKIYFINTNLITTYVGNTFFTGDPLQYGPSQVVFASRYGRNYTVANTNCTITPINPTTIYPNERGFTVNTVTGASPQASLYIALTNLTEANRQYSNSDYFVVVYTSNVPVNVYLSNGSGQVAPTQTLGTMPAANAFPGAYVTYAQFNYDAFSGAYTTLEFVVSSASAGNTFTLREVYFADDRMICTEPTNSTTQPTLNLYKC